MNKLFGLKIYRFFLLLLTLVFFITNCTSSSPNVPDNTKNAFSKLGSQIGNKLNSISDKKSLTFSTKATNSYINLPLNITGGVFKANWHHYDLRGIDKNTYYFSKNSSASLKIQNGILEIVAPGLPRTFSFRASFPYNTLREGETKTLSIPSSVTCANTVCGKCIDNSLTDDITLFPFKQGTLNLTLSSGQIKITGINIVSDIHYDYLCRNGYNEATVDSLEFTISVVTSQLEILANPQSIGTKTGNSTTNINVTQTPDEPWNIKIQGEKSSCGETTPIKEFSGSGSSTLTWNGKDNNGKSMPNGTYIATLSLVNKPELNDTTSITIDNNREITLAASPQNISIASDGSTPIDDRVVHFYLSSNTSAESWDIQQISGPSGTFSKTSCIDANDSVSFIVGSLFINTGTYQFKASLKSDPSISSEVTVFVSITGGGSSSSSTSSTSTSSSSTSSSGGDTSSSSSTSSTSTSTSSTSSTSTSSTSSSSSSSSSSGEPSPPPPPSPTPSSTPIPNEDDLSVNYVIGAEQPLKGNFDFGTASINEDEAFYIKSNVVLERPPEKIVEKSVISRIISFAGESLGKIAKVIVKVGGVAIGSISYIAGELADPKSVGSPNLVNIDLKECDKPVDIDLVLTIPQLLDKVRDVSTNADFVVAKGNDIVLRQPINISKLRKISISWDGKYYAGTRKGDYLDPGIYSVYIEANTGTDKNIKKFKSIAPIAINVPSNRNCENESDCIKNARRIGIPSVVVPIGDCKVYRRFAFTEMNFTPRPNIDTSTGWSTDTNTKRSFSEPNVNKVQIIDLTRLSQIETRLVPVLDGNGHVSIRPGTALSINTNLLNEWANTRGTNNPHELTIKLMNVRVGEIPRPKK